ncbi:ATP synthase F0 subunit B [bacterium]|nr:ATP synthase F0 subunit B [bacterium]
MHEPVLTPDLTFFIQMGIFFATYFVLNHLVFKPYLALLKARREQTVGLTEAAEKDRAEAVRLQREYELYVKAERQKNAAWADEERKKIGAHEQSILQTARSAASAANDAARASLEEETQKARRSLESSVQEFSSAIVSKMLGRKVQVSAGSASRSSQSQETART